jgi:RimJ/RimL family protein N-acetyltransferase
LSIIKPRSFVLKNGQTLFVQSAQMCDATALISYLNQVGRESDNLTFGANELDASVKEEEYFIYSMAQSLNSLCLTAVLQEELAGVLTFRGGTRPRIRHQGEFGITVLQRFWNVGIGRILLECLLDWARENGTIRKINLTVRADNNRAIRLYEDFGFVREGQVTRHFLIEGQFFDAILMGIVLDSEKE